MFDFSRESKERYFLKAEQILQDKKLAAEIDRERISVVGKLNIKVYIRPVSIKGNYHTIQKLKKLTTPEKDIKIEPLDYPNKPMYYKGYFLLKLDKEDT